ncbi:MAG: uroporphyrinogen decarboxylase family protein, partial [Candidatus Omnitrophica bacterium]|nr:uroporphyrinogen decarboxylase family protein [Candidatus Omnitrophota bacterium]
MRSDERIKRVLAGKIPDRVPICEVSFWPKTIERWKKEGLPEDVDVYEYLEMDRITIFYYNSGFYPETKILDERDEYYVFIDNYGKKVKDWKPNSPNYGVPYVIEYPLKSKEDWDRMKQYLNPDEKRIPENIVDTFLKVKERGDFTALTIEEPAWFVLERTFGFENGLPLFIENKELILEIMEKVTEFNLEMCKMVLNKGVRIDTLWIWSDLCYKNGMFFSPEIFKELVIPCHQRIKKFCKEHGLFLIFHCDGYVKEIIPLLIEVGVDAIQPLEARCGNDVREYKKIFGDKITLFGNISAEVLSSDRERIKEEIKRKVGIAMENGRYIFHSDHSVPHTVSLKN